MKRAYFITGTDTGVGKTFVTALLASAFKESGVDTGVMKPVETGCIKIGHALVPADALRLKEAASSADPLDLINPYRFKDALAPSVAARLENRRIDFKTIKKCLLELLKRHEVLLIEGAGGVMAPLTEKKTILDLAAYLKTPLIIVAASRLGVINHTLLTVEAARTRGIGIHGIILNRADNLTDASLKANRSEIERFTGIQVLAEVPFIKKKAAFLKEDGLFNAIRPAINSMT